MFEGLVPVDRTVWEGLGDMNLLEEGHHWGWPSKAHAVEVSSLCLVIMGQMQALSYCVCVCLPAAPLTSYHNDYGLIPWKREPLNQMLCFISCLIMFLHNNRRVTERDTWEEGPVRLMDSWLPFSLCWHWYCIGWVPDAYQMILCWMIALCPPELSSLKHFPFA